MAATMSYMRLTLLLKVLAVVWLTIAIVAGLAGEFALAAVGAFMLVCIIFFFLVVHPRMGRGT